MSEALVVSLLHVVAGFFFHCLLLFLYSSTFMIFQCPLNQSTLFPLSFLTQTLSLTTHPKPSTKIISVFSFSFHTLLISITIP